MSLKERFKKFLNDAILIHGDKYDYSQVDYINMHTKIKIICQKHGEFESEAFAHLKGRVCPKCHLCPSCELWKTKGELCSYCKNIKSKYFRIKKKELVIVKFLKNALPDHEFIHNKSVGKDCTDGHLFPDIRFDCKHYQLIIEIDEHKHRGSPYECDKQRMLDIIAKLGQPCIFIRYNPDSVYSDKDILLDTIEDHLDLSDNVPIAFDDYGLKCIYLFY